MSSVRTVCVRVFFMLWIVLFCLESYVYVRRHIEIEKKLKFLLLLYTKIYMYKVTYIVRQTIVPNAHLYFTIFSKFLLFLFLHFIFYSLFVYCVAMVQITWFAKKKTFFFHSSPFLFLSVTMISTIFFLFRMWNSVYFFSFSSVLICVAETLNFTFWKCSTFATDLLFAVIEL